jgi:hypothetical protein
VDVRDEGYRLMGREATGTAGQPRPSRARRGASVPRFAFHKVVATRGQGRVPLSGPVRNGHGVVGGDAGWSGDPALQRSLERRCANRDVGAELEPLPDSVGVVVPADSRPCVAGNAQPWLHRLDR